MPDLSIYVIMIGELVNQTRILQATPLSQGYFTECKTWKYRKTKDVKIFYAEISIWA